MTLNARFAQLRRNDGRVGGGGVRRGGIVKRGGNRGGTNKNRLLALQMANRPSVRAALTRTDTDAPKKYIDIYYEIGLTTMPDFPEALIVASYITPIKKLKEVL